MHCLGWCWCWCWTVECFTVRCWMRLLIPIQEHNKADTYFTSDRFGLQSRKCTFHLQNKLGIQRIYISILTLLYVWIVIVLHWTFLNFNLVDKEKRKKQKKTMAYNIHLPANNCHHESILLQRSFLRQICFCEFWRNTFRQKYLLSRKSMVPR